jgi:hypothetical protein
MKKLLLGLFLLCSALTVSAQDYQISVENGITKSVSKNGVVFTDSDFSKVFQQAVNSFPPAIGGSINIGSGWFFMNDEVTLAGTGNNMPPNAQITVTGQGYSTQLIQNTKGKNAIVVKNSASIVLKSMYIYVGKNSKCGILFDTTRTKEQAVWGGIIDGVFVQSNSLTDAAVHLKNFFDLSVPHLSVSSSDNYGIILENISKTVSYGNSNFGFVRSTGPRNAYAGLLLKSSDANKPMNLNTFQNYESVGSYRGILSMVSARNIFQLVDIEDAFQPIYFDGSDKGGDTRYNQIKGGYLLARDGGTAITNTKFTGGNEFKGYVEDTAKKQTIDDRSQYRPINEYDLDVYMGQGKVAIGSPKFPLRIKKVDGTVIDNRNK